MSLLRIGSLLTFGFVRRVIGLVISMQRGFRQRCMIETSFQIGSQSTHISQKITVDMSMVSN